MARVPATEFKAKCLELMDRVAERRETYVITKRGRAVAKLVPADPERETSIFGCMAGQTMFVGDVEKPSYTEGEWKAFERQRREQAQAWEREWRTYGTISGKKTTGQPSDRGRQETRKTSSRSKR
jgi:prevent-host-death family protein